MTLGQEFEAFARDAGRRGPRARSDPARAVRDQHGRDGDRHRPERAGRLRAEVHGTSGDDHRAARSTSADDLIEATQDTQAFVLYSSCMKSLAIKLSKVCNDLRLLSSGPRCGLREINLPAEAAGLVDHAGQGQPGDSRRSSTWSASASSAAT